MIVQCSEVKVDSFFFFMSMKDKETEEIRIELLLGLGLGVQEDIPGVKNAKIVIQTYME
jgi:hypothetical protein